MNFEEYILNVKSQLYCNASEEYKSEHITYMFSNKQIEDNIEYFKKCFDRDLSGYKALLFFKDYLDEK
jgi:hypothetical protein